MNYDWTRSSVYIFRYNLWATVRVLKKNETLKTNGEKTCCHFPAGTRHNSIYYNIIIIEMCIKKYEKKGCSLSKTRHRLVDTSNITLFACYYSCKTWFCRDFFLLRLYCWAMPKLPGVQDVHCTPVPSPIKLFQARYFGSYIFNDTPYYDVGIRNFFQLK